MFYSDAHCDTVMKLSPLEIGMISDKSMMDFPRLAALPAIATMAVFPHIEKRPPDMPAIAMDMAKKIQQAAMLHKDLVDFFLWRQDWLAKTFASGKGGILMSLEGGEALDDSLARLEEFFALGVRSIGLTWNFENSLAGGVKEPGPLKPFGKAVVKLAEQKGMAVDLAHSCPETFYQVLQISQKPPLVSHSACYALCPHPRNLRDAQIKAIAEQNGMIGITFYPPFLTRKPQATIEDVVRHIDYAVSLAGYEHIGIGSDFDGIDSLPLGMQGIQDLPEIAAALCTHGYGLKEIAAVMGGNFRRYWQEIMPPCGT